MADRDVTIKGLKVPTDTAARSRVLAQIKKDLDGIHAEAVRAVDKLAVKTIAGIDVHAKESVHGKVDGHVKSKVPDVGDIGTIAGRRR
jgi:hypothetical protein